MPAYFSRTNKEVRPFDLEAATVAAMHTMWTMWKEDEAAEQLRRADVRGEDRFGHVRSRRDDALREGFGAVVLVPARAARVVSAAS